jgi:hypothetical protein
MLACMFIIATTSKSYIHVYIYNWVQHSKEHQLQKGQFVDFRLSQI